MLRTVSSLTRSLSIASRSAAAYSSMVVPTRGIQEANKYILMKNMTKNFTSGVLAPTFSTIMPRLRLNGMVLPGVGQDLLSPRAPSSVMVRRTVIKWSLRKGKRKTVQAVLKRFKRIPWGGRGIWIRPKQAASKRMWKKSPRQRRKCKAHVFCNATQSHMLDKMVTRYWRKTRHYPDDPYRSYMRRDTFYLTRGYPREYF